MGVEKVHFPQNSQNLGDRKCLGKLRKSFVGHPDAILFLRISREGWGRFQNNDEAAYYEFLCSSSGTPLHYCAEPFANDGTATSTLLKALKRSMAAEFSRELGEKEFRGKSRIVQLGFRGGGVPGYGYRRLMVSADGKAKQVLKPGEQKSIKTDRIILVLGPRKELECVRHMFSMALEGHGCNVIVRDLNRSRITHYGRPWSHRAVFSILTNPKYAGCNVWHRTSKRLRDKRTLIETQGWIMKPGAFAPIVEGVRRQLLQLNNRRYTVAPTRRLEVSRDPDGNRFRECANAARADYLVTGNLRHFPRF